MTALSRAAGGTGLLSYEGATVSYGSLIACFSSVSIMMTPLDVGKDSGGSGLLPFFIITRPLILFFCPTMTHLLILCSGCGKGGSERERPAAVALFSHTRGHKLFELLVFNVLLLFLFD